MARVITARRADTCGDCSGAIAAGEQINYGGYGAVSHAACKPVESNARSGRSGRRSYAYTGSGARMTMSSRRCEDAPCCGCCD
jgi:hypothetical protein